MNVAQMAVQLYVEVIVVALPIAIVFEVGNLMVGTFLRSAFGGKLWFGVK